MSDDANTDAHASADANANTDASANAETHASASADADSPEAIAHAYASGRRRFMGLDLAVGAGALVPRAETELLARTAAELLVDITMMPGAPIVVIDMCCGAGNIACALAAHDARLLVYAADLTAPCVALCRRNFAALGLEGRVSVHEGDLFAALAGLPLAGRADMIVANPPYISTARLAPGKDRAALLAREPVEAFDGGPYGLSVHQRLIREAPAFLRPDGWLLFEIGAGQDRQIRALFQRSGYDPPTFIADNEGRPRVAVARRPRDKATGPERDQP